MVKPQTKKIEAIQDLPRPQVNKQLRRFWVMAGYYSHFNPNFAAIACPLTDHLTKGRPETLRWDADAERALTQLKAALCAAPVLHNPDFTFPFILQMDTSD